MTARPVVTVGVRSISFGDGIGGMERAAGQHVRQLVDAGVEVRLFAPAEHVHGQLPPSVVLVDVPWPRWDRRTAGLGFGPAYRQWNRRLASALLARRAPREVWHLHGGAAGVLRRRSVRRSRVPTVVNPHGMEEFGSFDLLRYPRRVFLRSEARQARHASRVIATDTPLVDAVVRNLRVARERVVVIPNCVDAAALRRQADGATPPARFEIVTVGRLVRNKGYDLLLDALRRPEVRRVLPADAAWVHFGSGPYAERLRTAAATAGVPLSIRERRTDVEVQRALSTAGMFVQPSRHEGSSLTTLEAMAHGRVVVGTPVGGIPDKVVDGRTGFLARSATAEALADAIVRAAGAAPDVGLAAAREVDERFDLAAMTAVHLALYAGLTGAVDGHGPTSSDWPSSRVDGADRSTVAVCVPTYRRHRELEALLPLLVEQARSVEPSATVVVVDNDETASARDIVERFSGSGCKVRYVHEPEPGIAAARNAAIAAVHDVDVVMFVDDDERPVGAWLRTMIDVYEELRPAAVVGPVVSHFDVPPDPWVRAFGFPPRPRFATGTSRPMAATNNLLLDMRTIRALGLTFDQRFGLTGGSDTLLTRQLVRAGGRIVWCDDAEVHEDVPAHRLTSRWVYRRALRGGNTWSRTSVVLADGPLRRTGARLVGSADGVARMAVGVLLAGAGVVSRDLDRRARGVRTAMIGAGRTLGAVGVTLQEYHR
ncbi:glycosyltransferase family 4 protein [Cellulomonas sp.]|uniref:glycosyltransferase n=1 Tax=Cellulomonas sp. TaxID=40001 RepID=UPI001B21F41E|nr:glycosyltransferase family 4 protein [Cellulomonas sp.]MBO9553130.1 glycosyltransferase family 4 protein [Cellulomonas sp.]